MKLSFLKVKKVDIETEIKIDAKIDCTILTNKEHEIAQLLHKHKMIVRKQGEDLLEVKNRRANDIMRSLIDKDIIVMVGTTRDAKYKMKQ